MIPAGSSAGFVSAHRDKTGEDHMKAKHAAEEARNAAESETGRKLRALQRENLEGAALQAGLDLKNYEATAQKRLGGLMDLAPRLMAEQHEALPEVEGAVKSLVPRSREIMRAQDWVFYKPDPFGPVDVFTDGPFQDHGAPPPLTARVCRVVGTMVADTSANHGAAVSQVVTGSEDAATVTENFDATPGCEPGTLHLRPCRQPDARSPGHHFRSRVPRFNYMPTVTGEYRVRPAAILNGAWQLLASSDPLFTTAASIEVRFATRVIQDSQQGGNTFFHNVLLADESVNGDGRNGVVFLPDGDGKRSGRGLRPARRGCPGADIGGLQRAPEDRRALCGAARCRSAEALPAGSGDPRRSAGLLVPGYYRRPLPGFSR